MADTISFDQFLARLPVGNFNGHSSLEFQISAAPAVFVPPTLRVVDEVSAPNVTLISARGAAGKSVLSQTISARKNTPLWRLDQDLSVSGHALGAKLNAYLDTNNGLAGFEKLDNAFIIIDALDEGRVRVSGISWIEFIASLASAASPRYSFVLLGRERILEDVWANLADAGIGIDWFEISHFDADQRVEYINRRLSGERSPENSAYVSARSVVLAALAGAVDPEQADSFVGYAPVLDAVVALLRRGNLVEIENVFSSENPDARRVNGLIDILRQLLEREQGKIRSLADQLGLDIALAYSPDEQIEWLAAELLGGDEPLLAWCSPGQRIDYVNQVREFLQDHPFRSESRWASPVFSAYVAAQRFGDPRLRPALRLIGESTGLLFEFVSEKGERLLIDEWQFAALHASLLAAEWQAVEVVVSIEESQRSKSDFHLSPIEQTSGELVLLETGSHRRSTNFDLVLERSNWVTLIGPLASISVIFPASVLIGSPGASISIGPDCFIRCSELQIQGDTAQISRRPLAGRPGNGQDDLNVIFEVTERFTSDASLTGNPPVGSFYLRVPSDQRLTYPWVTYRTDLEPSPVEPNERAVRFLNMLMNLLRHHGHKGPMAVYDKKLEGRQSIKGDEFAAVISNLQNMGVLTKDGSIIFLTPEWEGRRFSGKAQTGMLTLNDLIDVWRPVLDRIALIISR